jgi:DNA-directed RNA polymerase subunit RPC12/RpoP
MSQLCCPRCGSRKVGKVRRSAWSNLWSNLLSGSGQCHWRCHTCGEECSDPKNDRIFSPKLDIGVGVAMLASLLTAVFGLLL